MSSIFAPEERKKTVEQFRTSGPYQHAVIRPFAQDGRLRAVHDELVQNLTANLKESDLFKVYQTCDLANLGRNGVMEELAAKMPQLIALRDAIYSPEFKSFVQEVTGCGELSDQVDCATNLHTQGCHLLCHDDVIGTRKVSYIIYLTSPDEEWTREVPARSDRLDRRASRPRVRPTQTGARRLKLALPKVDFGKCRAAAGWRGAGAVPVHHPGCCVPPPRTKWTHRVLHPVLIGHAASLTGAVPVHHPGCCVLPRAHPRAPPRALRRIAVTAARARAGTPATFPSKVLVPLFNTIALFNVQVAPFPLQHS